ncbi:Uncharacterized protein TCM_011142 [Theobroma cacao]|uniref:Uncharacterized protein n=1 Tax=Theobroma cacao TaxID=3641 RepID=A0A061E8D9_THECC|nr:Uncharacterized protein TCM_011142 [Theobroma cacao]
MDDPTPSVLPMSPSAHMHRSRQITCFCVFAISLSSCILVRILCANCNACPLSHLLIAIPLFEKQLMTNSMPISLSHFVVKIKKERKKNPNVE